jgi:ABC-2 type transport system ATP-binding protein
MSEMAQTATNLIVIGRGRLIADSTVEQFIATTTVASVVVRSPETGRLRGLLDRPGVRIATEGPDLLRIDGITSEEVGTIALQAHVPVFDLRVERASLEDAFMRATHDSVEYGAAGLENL